LLEINGAIASKEVKSVTNTKAESSRYCVDANSRRTPSHFCNDFQRLKGRASWNSLSSNIR